MQKLGASFGYTLDGGEAGDLEDETFSADGALVTHTGRDRSPGYAKDKMVNALKVAGAILDALPKGMEPKPRRNRRVCSPGSREWHC